MRTPKSFALRRRRGVEEVIALLMLILIVVSLVFFVLVFGTGVIAALQRGGTDIPVTASGQMVVPGSTSDQAVLTLDMRNSDNQQIVGISVDCPSSEIVSSGNGACSSVIMEYQNTPVTAATPLPLESTAIGTSALLSSSGNQFQSGQTYTVLLTLTFRSGAQETVDVEVTAIA